MCNFLTVVICGLFFTTVHSKSCSCGSNCDTHKGYRTNDKCYFVAQLNPLHGKQFLVSNEQEEEFVLKSLFKNNSKSNKTFIGTNKSYILQRFHSTCLPRRCTHTVYSSDCQCTLNFFEKTWQEVENIYNKYPEVFWTVSSVLIVLIVVLILKCVIC